MDRPEMNSPEMKSPDFDRILDAIDHPPRAVDATRDAGLTAAVMSRVRVLPTPAERRRARLGWMVAAMLAAAATFVPIEWIDLGEAIATWDDAMLPEFIILIALALLGAAALQRRSSHDS